VYTAATTPGRLDAWIDFNNDGSFDPVSERITDPAGTLLTGNGTPDTLVFNIPSNATPTDLTYARFRFSSAGGLLPTGPASDGEVEDHTVSIEDRYDYGDAPAPYPTLLADNGARHLKVPGFYLGYSNVDGEPDGQPAADASGDDNDFGSSGLNSDDEDGIASLPRLSAGQSASVDIIASQSGLLNAWIDFNADGDWNDTGEQVAVNVPLFAGTNSLQFSVPEDAVPGATFARLRFSSVGGLTPTGDAPDGEVEDYRVSISALSVEDLTGPLEPVDLANQLVGDGVTISNVVYTGAEIAAGRFTRGPQSVGFDTGILLSSGSVHNVIGPNSSDGITGNNGTPGDSALDTLSGFQTFDASVLEFDFIPDSDVVVFRYVFASDEYNEFVNSSFNDTFAFFVNGVNYATTGTGQPISINTINRGNPFGSGGSNSNLYRNNDLSDGGGSLDTEMDGLTVILTLAAPVNPGATNHMKLAIADASDRALDSVVFIETGSFQTAQVDFGDAPDSYGTLLTSDGARHAIVPGLFLGSSVDGEPDGLPGVNANGDDLSGSDDENGVVFSTPLLPGEQATIQVTASDVGLLDAWIDFDDDGEFDSDEKLQGDTIALMAGANQITFVVPEDAVAGSTYARFRFSRQGDLDPNGFAADGEVEDYTVVITENRGAITIVKDARPNDGQNFSFNGDLGSFSLDDDSDPALSNIIEFLNRVSGTYIVTEAAESGWDLSGLVIVDPDGGSSVDLVNRTATIDLDVGENITVTFTNSKRGAITVVKQASPEDPQDFTFTGDLGSFLLDDDDDGTLDNEQDFENLVSGTEG